MAAEQDPFAEFGGTQTEDPFKEFGGRSVSKKASANGSGNGSQRLAVGSGSSLSFRLNTPNDFIPDRSNEAPLILTPDKQQEYLKQAKTYVKSKSKPKTLQQAAEDDDSYLGALWNTVVGSVSDAVSGAANLVNKYGGRNPSLDLLAKAESFTNKIGEKITGLPATATPIGNLNRELEARTAIKGEQAGQLAQQGIESLRSSASSKENEEAILSGFDLGNPDAKKIGKALPLMLTRLGADIGLSIPSGGLSFLAQGYKQGLDDYDKEIKKGGIKPDENSRELFGLAYGTINGLFDKLGADAILKNNAVSKTIKNAILKRGITKLIGSGEKVTAEAIEQTLSKVATETLNKVKEAGVKAAIAGATEGGTEAIQGGLSDALKVATNKLSDKNIFDTEGVKEDFWVNRLNDLAGGAILGGVLGGLSHGTRSTNSYVAERVAEATTPEQIESIRAELQQSVDNGETDPERAQEVNNALDRYAKIKDSIPQGLDVEKRAKVIQLIDQRNTLDEATNATVEATTQLDPALQSEEPTLDLENKKESINDQIREVVSGKKYKYVEEDGKFYKQLGEGKKEEITPEYYQLQKQDGIQEVRENERADREIEDENKASETTSPIDSTTNTTEQLQEPTGAINESNEQTQQDFNTEVSLPEAPEQQTQENVNQETQIGGQENAIEEGNIQQSSEPEYQGTDGQQQGVEENRINQEEPVQEAETQTSDSNIPEESRQVETQDVDGNVRTQSQPVKLSKKAIKETSEELGLPEIQLDPARKDAQVSADANEYIKDDDKLFKLVDKLNGGEKVAITDTEVAALTQALANRRGQYDTVRGKLLNAIKEGDQRLVDELSGQREALVKDIADIQSAGRKASREIGRSLRQFNVSKIEDNSLEGFLDRAIAANNNKIPPKEIQDLATKAYEEYQKAQDEYQAKINELENRIVQLENEAVINKAKKEAEARTRQRRTATLEEKKARIQQERKVILKELFEVAKKQRGNLNAGLNLDLAKPIYKLAKNYVEEGIVELDKVVSKIYEDIKDEIEGISERDIRDAISGYGRELNKTRSELSTQIQELRTQAKMISAIEDLEAGLQRWKPNSAKHKEASERVKELRAQLKELIGDETRLSAYKSRTLTRIKEYQRRISEGDYLPPDKKLLQLDEEAKVLRDQALRVKHDYAVELEKYRLSQRTKVEKAVDLAVNVQGLVKSLKATWDLSAPFRQGLIASVAHPVTAFEAFTKMHKAAWSQEYFERWQNDLKESEVYPLMKESKLALTDTTSPELMAREEDWTSNLSEKIPGLGRLTKGSERAYSFYLNYLRANIFQDGVRQLMESGYTFENNPNEFKSLARVINNETGRGGLGKFERYNNVASLAIWSPRLMMSRINTFTSLFDPSYSLNARKRAALDLLKFIGFASTMMFLASSNDDWEVDYDPRSSNFGKIKVGNNRYSLMGGMEGYVTAMAKIFSGEYKNKKGKIAKLKDAPFGGMTELDVAGRFLRGKLAPDLGIIFNLLDHKDVVGNSYELWDVPDEVLPLSLVESIESYQRGGTAEVLKTLPFSTYGVGISSYDANQKKKRQRGVFESLYYKAIGK